MYRARFASFPVPLVVAGVDYSCTVAVAAAGVVVAAEAGDLNSD